MEGSSKDESGPPPVADGGAEPPAVSAEVLALLQRLLADGLAGVWLFGSAVDGGLRPRSDVDFLIALHASLDEPTRRALVTGLVGVSGDPASGSPLRPLEVTAVVLGDVVPWRYPPRKDFVYGEWLRTAFDAGWVPEPVDDPDLAVLIHTARRRSVTLAGPLAADTFEPVPRGDIRRAIVDSLPALIRELPGDERNVVLTLARMWVTLETDEIAPKDAAAAWVAARLPESLRPVVELARAGYLGECADDWSDRGEAVAAFVAHACGVIRALAQA